MLPHTLVLKPGLVIYLYNGYWFWCRPSFDDLRRDLGEVLREVRPDWDRATPGPREAWNAGVRSNHYPQGLGKVMFHQVSSSLTGR